MDVRALGCSGKCRAGVRAEDKSVCGDRNVTGESGIWFLRACSEECERPPERFQGLMDVDLQIEPTACSHRDCWVEHGGLVHLCDAKLTECGGAVVVKDRSKRVCTHRRTTGSAS